MKNAKLYKFFRGSLFNMQITKESYMVKRLIVCLGAEYLSGYRIKPAVKVVPKRKKRAAKAARTRF